MVPDTTNNSYLLEVDGNNCYTIGDAVIAANTWVWTNYQNGNTASPVDITLTAGAHTLKLIGREPSVKVDRILLLESTTCTPSGIGDNCTNVGDTTPPTVAISTPAANATVSGTVNLTATAADETGGSGVAKVEFYLNNVLAATDTSSPYSYSWNTTGATNGTVNIQAKAYDVAGNSSVDTRAVTVNNQVSDTQVPTAPNSLTATAISANKINLSWVAGSDNVGVAGYTIMRNGVQLIKTGTTATTYSDTTVLPGTQYSYQVSTYDAAGNVSTGSNTASATTPALPVADTTAPSVPTGLVAVATSASQISLTWNASTDNVGVAGYDVYRSTGTGSATKVAAATTTTYGEGSLSASTQYTYYVVAKDAAGNVSSKSVSASATTSAAIPPSVQTGSIKGKITVTVGRHWWWFSKRQKPIANATVTVYVNNAKRVYNADANGNYLIDQLPTGMYSLRVRAPGYSSEQKSVRVSKNTTQIINFTLSQD